MKTSERLKTLRALADMAYRRDAARMAELRGQEAALRQAAAHWMRHSAYMPEPGEPTPMSAVAAWQGHATLLGAKAEAEAEALVPEIDNAHAALGRSFGRRQALARVIERAERREAPPRHRS